jgi:potassium uptake TrkH family protein
VLRATTAGQFIAILFAGAILIGTALLMLPFATVDGASTSFVDALFTATSAVCVTGLTVVDTGSHWTTFGEVVILALIQVGGLGIMTAATVIVLLFFRRLGLRARSAIQTETKAWSAVDVRGTIRRIVIYTFALEAVLTIVLAARFAVHYDEPLGRASYLGLFHAISAFNNAGFALFPDNLMGFAGDPVILLPISLAVIIGGLGFPVVFELARSWRRPSSWSVLVRITLTMTIGLLVFGTVVFYAAEARNPETLGSLPAGQAVMLAGVTSVMTRTAGFNALDIGAMSPESWLATDLLMFIGGGSAGTAGGVKVTTVGILAFVVWAELRGRPDVTVGRRRVSSVNQRQALSVVLLAVVFVALSSLLLLSLSDEPADQVVFEAISAFATVGLSTGITADLSDPAKLVLVVMMFVGRLGPLTLASALALRERPTLTRMPEERVIVG